MACFTHPDRFHKRWILIQNSSSFFNQPQAIIENVLQTGRPIAPSVTGTSGFFAKRKRFLPKWFPTGSRFGRLFPEFTWFIFVLIVVVRRIVVIDFRSLFPSRASRIFARSRPNSPEAMVFFTTRMARSTTTFFASRFLSVGIFVRYRIFTTGRRWTRSWWNS